jgi:hypothetical protein
MRASIVKQRACRAHPYRVPFPGQNVCPYNSRPLASAGQLLSLSEPTVGGAMDVPAIGSATTAPRPLLFISA